MLYRTTSTSGSPELGTYYKKFLIDPPSQLPAKSVPNTTSSPSHTCDTSKHLSTPKTCNLNRKKVDPTKLVLFNQADGSWYRFVKPLENNKILLQQLVDDSELIADPSTLTLKPHASLGDEDAVSDDVKRLKDQKFDIFARLLEAEGKHPQKILLSLAVVREDSQQN